MHGLPLTNRSPASLLRNRRAGAIIAHESAYTKWRIAALVRQETREAGTVLGIPELLCLLMLIAKGLDAGPGLQ